MCDRRGRPLSRSALVKVRSVFGQVIASAERRGWVSNNVARLAEITPLARRPEARRVLDPEQIAALCKVSGQHRLGAMFVLMVTLGLRPGEASGIHWSDFDRRLRTLSVRHTVRLEHGRLVVAGDLKTARSHRTLALSRPAVIAVRGHLTRHRGERRAARMAGLAWPHPGLVFPTSRGTPLSPSNVRRELGRLCEVAGVPVVLPNELRHSAASALSDRGVPLEQIADLLGHADTRMLDQTYRHRVRPAISASVDVMDTLLG